VPAERRVAGELGFPAGRRRFGRGRTSAALAALPAGAGIPTSAPALADPHLLDPFLLLPHLVHRGILLLGPAHDLRALLGLRERHALPLDALLPPYLRRLAEENLKVDREQGHGYGLLINPSLNVSYLVTRTSPPCRKKVTNLNSVRTASEAFLMASRTPGNTRSEAEILPIDVSDIR
jgi:hypothetical protein